MQEHLAPGFLIAVPQLMDGNFHRSVVFLIEHGEAGAFGLVINRPSEILVRDFLASLDISYRGEPDARVLIGGPVQPERGLVLHSEGNTPGDSRQVTGAIYASSTPASLARLFSRENPRVLCFAGYSGWGPGQLEGEIEEGAWIPASPDDELVFDKDRGGLWEKALRGLGIDPASIVPGGSVN